MILMAIRMSDFETPLGGWTPLDIDDDWREAVRAARKRRKLTGRELATEIYKLTGCKLSQSAISQIESLKADAPSRRINRSWAVTPISRFLKVPPPPQPTADELEERWGNAGRTLRTINRDQFLGMLSMVEAAAGALSQQASAGAPDEDALTHRA